MREIDYLREKIRKTGFPLEIEVSSLLRDRWDVLYRESFFDRDEKKIRDIDLRALYSFDVSKLLPLWLDEELIIECKKTKNFAWVFFTVPMEYAPEESIDGQYLDEIQIHLKNSNARQLRDIIIGDTRLHYHDFERFAISFDEVYLKGTKGEYGTGKRQIFAAENQLKKFIAGTHEKSFEEELHLSEMKRIAVYFPCVVFDGKIFEVIVEKGELELKKSRHLILTSQYIPSYSTSEQNFLIDIVHKSYFKNYLKKITRDITSLSETIIKNRNELIKRIEDVEAIL